MNRSLVIPAGCCLVAFGALLVTFHAVAGRESAARSSRFADASIRRDGRTMSLASSLPALTPSEGKLPLSAAQAEKLLTALSGEYLRPWREWEASPRRFYSRAAPRPIPTISAEVAVAPEAEDSSFVLATIVVRTGDKSEPIACVVDRTTKRSRMFSDGEWLTQEDWLKKAPLP